MLLVMLVQPAAKAEVPDYLHPELMRRTSYYRTGMWLDKMFKEYNSIQDVDKDAGIALLERMIDTAMAYNHPRAVFVAIDYLSTDLNEKGDYRGAVNAWKRAIPSSKEKANKNYVHTMYAELGQAYSSLNKFDSALSCYYKALSVLGTIKETKSSIDSAYVYNRIGILWETVDYSLQAIDAYKLGLSIAERKQDTEMIGMLYFDLGQTYITLDSLSLAKESFKKAWDLAEGSMFHQVSGLVAFAQVSYEEKKYGEVIPYLQQALANLQKTSQKDASQSLSIRLSLGKVLVKFGKQKQGDAILTAAYKDVAGSVGSQEWFSMEKTYSKVLARAGNHKDAFRHLHDYINANDTRQQNEIKNARAIWMNAMLEEKNKTAIAQQLHIARQKTQLQQKNIWMGGVGLGTLLIVIICIATVRSYRHKQVIQLSQLEQLQQADEISQLKGQMLGTQQERRRTAQELHYGVAQQLMAITRQVADMQSVDSLQLRKENIAAVFQQLSTVASHVRKTAHSLMPDMLMTQGLAAALASMCQRMSNDKGLEIAFQEYGAAQQVDKEIELAIYRLAQELIQDAVARATAATPDTALLVQLSYVDGYMNITIEDNNATPVMPAVNGHANRLAQIKNRVAALKGSFDVQSMPGKGNTAYLEFDLQYF